MAKTSNQGAAAGASRSGNGSPSPKKRGLRWNYPRRGLGPVHRWIPSWRFVLASIAAVFIAGVGVLGTLYVTTDIPEPDGLALAQTTRVYYSDGVTEMGSFADIDREPVSLDTLPEYVGQSVIASEDKSFYSNSGIDLRGIARALVNNARGGAKQGGSTLTQQYVERYYLGTTTSYAGKLKEAIIALKIDNEQSKDKILENYLNTIYFGRGAYGIEMAAQRYFGISASDLNLSQAALLTAVIPAPSAWDPAQDAEQAEIRWHRVLNNMVSEGYITQADADAAVFPPTNSLERSNAFEGPNGYLLSTASTELINSGKFTADDINTQGLKIVTTIDKDKQQAAVDAVANLPEDRPANNKVGIVSTDPRTGSIYALYGGADFMQREVNAITQDRAQAGSTFKPFALLTYLEQGGSLWDRFPSQSPMWFYGSTEIVNFDELSRGNINLATATMHSVNTTYVTLNDEVGPENTMNTAIKAGLPADTLGLDDSLTNVLGSSSPHPIDMARAYGMFANRGVMHEPFIVKEVLDAQDESIYKGGDAGDRVFEQDDIDTLNYALQQVTQPGATGQTAGYLGRPVAGKTGTSSDTKSAWFIGYIPQMLTVVDMYQVGEDGSEEELEDFGYQFISGGTYPSDIWLDYMSVAAADMDVEEFAPLPDGAGRPQRDVPVTPTQEVTTPAETPTPTPSESATPTEEPTPTPSSTDISSGAPTDGTDTGGPVESDGSGGAAANLVPENPGSNSGGVSNRDGGSGGQPDQTRRENE